MKQIPFQIAGEIRGLNQLLINLEQLGSTKARAVSRRALVSSSSTPLKAAKQKAPIETGQLKKSLGKRHKTYRGSGTTIVVIGPRMGFKNPETGRNPVRYAHLVELGTANASPQPFLRPALMSTHGIVTNDYQRKVWAGIRREAEKMKK